MVAHIELPALDKENGPATLSRPVVTGLLRDELRFEGLVVTDSMAMDGVTKLGTPAENAVKAVQAGNDLLLDFTDTLDAFRGLRAAVASGIIPRARIESSVRKILTEKARLGLHKQRTIALDAIPLTVGTRPHAEIARRVSERAITLIKDDRNSVPLKLPANANLLYLSVLDYPRGWRIAAPSRALLPALRSRWPNVQAIEISDATSPNELTLVRSMATRFDAIVAGVFVRAASGTGRVDLAAPVAALLQDLARNVGRSNQPFVAAFFGSPYAPMSVPDIPAMLLTYDFSDDAEVTAVRAIAGEIPIGGKLPVALPGLLPLGHGLTRTAAAATP
jgi:beta-N-acetylhexosaminidase